MKKVENIGYILYNKNIGYILLKKREVISNAKVGSDISRVLYFFVIGKKVILTNGFIKKTQKTPKNEIERAKEYRADYLERGDKDE